MGLGSCCCSWMFGIDVWEMFSFEGSNGAAWSGRTVPKCHCQGSAPCSPGREGGLSLFPSWKPVQCQIFQLPANPHQSQGGFVTLIYILGGLPCRNHPAPSFPHPCSLFRSFHTLPWSRTSSCRLSSVVNPSRWEASGDDSSCIFPLLFTRCFN